MKKAAPEKPETGSSTSEVSAEGAPVETQKPVALPQVGVGVDPQLAADIEQEILDDGGYFRKTTLAQLLLRTDRPKILSTLERLSLEVNDPDARAELTKLRLYLGDRFDALEGLVLRHDSSTSGTVHYTDEAWMVMKAAAPIAESVRKVALKKLRDQPLLKAQFSPGLRLEASPQGLYDVMAKMITALGLPEKQPLYTRRRLRAALLAGQLQTPFKKLGQALRIGIISVRTGDLSAAIDAVLLQLHVAFIRVETEFDQIQRTDLAETFTALIPHRHGGRQSDRQANGGNESGTKPKAEKAGETGSNKVAETKSTPTGETTPAPETPAPDSEKPAGADKTSAPSSETPAETTGAEAAAKG